MSICKAEVSTMCECKPYAGIIWKSECALTESVP